MCTAIIYIYIFNVKMARLVYLFVSLISIVGAIN